MIARLWITGGPGFRSSAPPYATDVESKAEDPESGTRDGRHHRPIESARSLFHLSVDGRADACRGKGDGPGGVGRAVA